MDAFDPPSSAFPFAYDAEQDRRSEALYEDDPRAEPEQWELGQTFTHNTIEREEQHA